MKGVVSGVFWVFFGFLPVFGGVFRLVRVRIRSQIAHARTQLRQDTPNVMNLISIVISSKNIYFYVSQD